MLAYSLFLCVLNFVAAQVTPMLRSPSLLGGKRGSILYAGKHFNVESNYPLTPPVQTEKGLKYRIGIISDLDTGISYLIFYAIY